MKTLTLCIVPTIGCMSAKILKKNFQKRVDKISGKCYNEYEREGENDEVSG